MSIFGRIFGEKRAEPAVPIKGSELTAQERGTYARQLQSNPLWAELMDSLEGESFKIWATTDLQELEAREHLYRHYRALKMIRARIESFVFNAAYEDSLEARELNLPQPEEGR
jgi:hypothetical protein